MELARIAVAAVIVGFGGSETRYAGEELGMEQQQIQAFGLRRMAAIAALVALATLALAAATADRASAEAAICAEYPGLTQCDQPVGGDAETGDDVSPTGTGADPTTGGGTPSAIPGAGGPSAAAGGAGARGALPFTGYPLTPVILLLLALLVAGLTVRAYVAIRDRAQARATHS